MTKLERGNQRLLILADHLEKIERKTLNMTRFNTCACSYLPDAFPEEWERDNNGYPQKIGKFYDWNHINSFFHFRRNEEDVIYPTGYNSVRPKKSEVITKLRHLANTRS
jgi:hypothetical protein